MALDSNATAVVESMDSNDTGGAVSDGGGTTSDTPSATGVVAARVRNGKAVKRKHSVTDDGASNNNNKVNNGKMIELELLENVENECCTINVENESYRKVELVGENNLRIYCCTGQAQKKRVKRNGEADKGPQTKNTVALLNELRKNVVYEVESQSGPVHAPVFTMSVLVDGQKYYGKGRSKKLARAEAAAVALRDFVQFKDSTAALALTPNDLKHVDFTSDEQLENGTQPLLNTHPPTSSIIAAVPSQQQPIIIPSIVATVGAAVDVNSTTNNNYMNNHNNIQNHNNQSNTSSSCIVGYNKPQITTTNILSTTTNLNLISKERALLESVQRSLALHISSKFTTTQNNSTTTTTTTGTTNDNMSIDQLMNQPKEYWVQRLEKISKSLAAQAEQGKNVCEKGPVMLLHEIFNDAQFECLSSDGPQHSKFKVQVLVNSGRFEGTGPSKKAARNAAAKAALATLCNISYSPMQQTTVAVPKLPNELGKNVELPQTFADVIGKLVLDKFSEIMKGNETYARRKVLAGFVMTRGADATSAQVICVSTGTKCINGEHLSVSGSVVNDCHAEIVSRRCLMFFFYQQLALHTTGNAEDAAESIFQAPRNGGHLYKLKPEIQFHLYINTAPCGDARVFSPHEADTVNGDKHPNRKARGQLRTKVESGEGTIPVKSSEGIQTWDGVLQGSRLLTMSCSDKIARWNVLGVQGSLLASIIEPIYLTSIVLGSLLHPDHMYRAICGRIENAVQGLPPPYRMNKPKLALMTSSEARSQIKAPNFSVNWVIGQEEVEIVNAFTGRPEVGGSVNRTSRLAKQMFFQRYANLARELPDIQAKDLNNEYGDIKNTVADYQMAKKELFGAFQREDFGLWLKKPIEQDQFVLLDLAK